MSHGKKAAAQIALLLAGAAMLCFGIWRGEAEMVLSKAIKLCLVCETPENFLPNAYTLQT